ncbi:hypothetical protein SO802_014402, partial [Lithocarpus litseifolius]
MAQREAHGGRLVAIDDVYERDKEEEDLDIKENDEYIERVCAINWDSPPIYDDYLEDFSQGDKIEFDKNKVIYIQ